MNHEIRVHFADGTSTLVWCNEDDDISAAALQAAEDCGLSAADVTGIEFTGRTSEGGE